MPTRLYTRITLVLFLVLVSIILQSIFLSLLSNTEERNQNMDYIRFYEPVAVNIMNGNGLEDTCGNLAVRYPPGFSLILAPVFRLAELLHTDRLQLIAIFNVVITAFNCVLIFLIGESVFNLRIGFLGALMWVTYPFHLWLIKQPNSELPFMFLLFLAICLFICALKRNRLLVVFFVGVILALSALVRPVSLMLIVVFMPMLMFSRNINLSRRTVSIFLLLAGFVITVLPWEYYVYSRSGDIIPLSTGGLPSIKDGLQFVIRPTISGNQASVPEDVMEFMVQVKNRDNQLETTGEVFDFVIQEFKENPGTIIKLYVIKIMRSWYATTEMWYENYIWPIQVFYLAFGIMGIIFAFRFYNERILIVLFFVAIIFYFWGMTVLVMSILRYMIPAMGLILIFAAIPVDGLLSRQRLYRKYVMSTDQ